MSYNLRISVIFNGLSLTFLLWYMHIVDNHRISAFLGVVLLDPLIIPFSPCLFSYDNFSPVRLVSSASVMPLLRNNCACSRSCRTQPAFSMEWKINIKRKFILHQPMKGRQPSLSVTDTVASRSGLPVTPVEARSDTTIRAVCPVETEVKEGRIHHWGKHRVVGGHQATSLEQ